MALSWQDQERVPRAVILLVVALMVAGLAGSSGLQHGARAERAPLRPVVTGWLPSWATEEGLAGVEANAALLKEASPFWYTARARDGATSVSTSVAAGTRAAVLARLRAHGISVIPSVADGSAAGAMATALGDPAVRAAHVAQLVDLVTSNGYAGIELDYEKFAFADSRSTWPATRPAWVAFVTELGGALHAIGRRLAVAVPVVYDGRQSARSGFWVYDYAGMADAVDSLRIMTYDYSSSRPGPIGPLAFAERVLAYAVTVFPADRIRVGIPAYGRLWVARRADGSPAITGTCPASGVPPTTSFTTAQALSHLTRAAGGPPSIRYDSTAGESVATFTRTYSGPGTDGAPTSCVVDHEAWWVDARGVAERMPLIERHRLAGAAVWHLGGLDPASWAAMRQFAESVAPARTTISLSAPARLVAGAGADVVALVSSAARVAAGTMVVLRARRAGSRTWRVVGRGVTDELGRVGFSVPGLAATTRWRVTTAASWDRTAGTATGRTRVAPEVRVTPSTTAPAPGERVRLRVRVAPARAGILVKRQALVKGRWRTWATTRTGRRGAATLSIRWPSTRASITYRIVTAPTGGLAAGYSGRVVVTSR